jgi:hypothetical protein
MQRLAYMEYTVFFTLEGHSTPSMLREHTLLTPFGINDSAQIIGTANIVGNGFLYAAQRIGVLVVSVWREV